MAGIQIALQTKIPVGCPIQRLFVLRGIGIDQGGVTNKDLSQAKVMSVTLGVDEQIETAIIGFPDKKFGSHFGFGYPIRICAETTSNVIFRGFITGETGRLAGDEDVMTVKAEGIKWYLNRLSKLRGKVYSVVTDFKRSQLKQLLTDSLKQKHQYGIKDEDDFYMGFLGAIPIIFNENLEKDCLIEDDYSDADRCVFKLPALIENFGEVRGESYHWNYAQILQHIVAYWVEPFVNAVSNLKVKMSQTGLQKILEHGADIGMEFIRPMNFDLTGLTPMGAIDKVVKSIPGNWIWRTIYDNNVVKIDIINLDDNPNIAKALIIGTGAKVALGDNTANVESVSVERNISNATTRAVAVGQAMKVETTVPLTPAWERYLRPISDFDAEAGEIEDDDGHDAPVVYEGQVPSGNYIADFKSPKDYKRWRKYIENVDFYVHEGELTSDEKTRYEKIYRHYVVFPKKIAPQFNLREIFENQLFTGTLGKQYAGYAADLGKTFFPHIAKIRKIEAPFTDFAALGLGDGYNFSNMPFVFTYDDYPARISDYLFVQPHDDEESSDLLRQRIYIVPTTEHLGYSVEEENNLVVFDEPQYKRLLQSAKMLNVSKLIPPFEGDRRISSRTVFMTCTIFTDVAFIIDREDATKRGIYNDLELVTYNFDETPLVLRLNAFYPNPKIISDGSEMRGVKTADLIYNDGKLSYSEPPSVEGKQEDWGNISFQVAGFNEIYGRPNQADYINNLLQFVYDLTQNAPKYDENISVSLARLDVGFHVGDKVKEIVNSHVSGEPNSGYYNLDCYVAQIEHRQDGEDQNYTTSMTIKSKDMPTRIERNIRSK